MLHSLHSICSANVWCHDGGYSIAPQSASAFCVACTTAGTTLLSDTALHHGGGYSPATGGVTGRPSLSLAPRVSYDASHYIIWWHGAWHFASFYLFRSAVRTLPGDCLGANRPLAANRDYTAATLAICLAPGQLRAGNFFSFILSLFGLFRPGSSAGHPLDVIRQEDTGETNAPHPAAGPDLAALALDRAPT